MKQPKPARRSKPRRVELVRPAYQPSKAELEEPITVAPMSLQKAARKLMEPVEIRYIDRPRRNS